MKFAWESIHKSESDVGLCCTRRAEVIGGWVLNNILVLDSNNPIILNESMVFIPDPEHVWEIEEE